MKEHLLIVIDKDGIVKPWKGKEDMNRGKSKEDFIKGAKLLYEKETGNKKYNSYYFTN